MKTQFLKCLLIVLVTALITAFITCYFCKNKETDIPGGTRDLATICMNYENEPPAVLPSGVVSSMVTTYGDSQLNSIQTASVNPVPKDARSIWFDLETLKKFMYQIEHNATTDQAQDQNRTLGVRIYYAAYPKNADMYQFAQANPDFYYNPAYEKLHTLVMIPTINGSDGQNYDFNPLDNDSYVGFSNMKRTGNYPLQNPAYQMLSLGSGCEPSVTIQTGTTPLQNPNVSARNHGMLFPPGNAIGIGF